jgi:hypothetical protein
MLVHTWLTVPRSCCTYSVTPAAAWTALRIVTAAVCIARDFTYSKRHAPLMAWDSGLYTGHAQIYTIGARLFSFPCTKS